MVNLLFLPANQVAMKDSKKKTIKRKKPATRAGQKKDRTTLLFVVSIFVFTMVLYGNTLFNSFALDDHHVIIENPSVQKGLKGIPEIFTTKYAHEEDLAYGYRPIVKTTYAIEYSLWGIRPGRAHIISALLYAFAGIILFYLLKRLFKDYHSLFPFLITLLFIAHPIHTEVVASLKNRDEILSLLFSFASLLTLLKYISSKKTGQVVLSIVFFILAILSKSSAGIFILIIPLILYFFTKTRLKTTLLITSGAIVILIVLLFLPKFLIAENIRPVMYFENPLFFVKDIWVRLGTGFYILIFYVKLLFFPHPLGFYYGFDMIPLVNLANFRVILSIVLHLSIFLYAVYKIKSKHVVSFAILYYLLSIAAYSNFIFPSPGIVAERFLFSASLGFCIVIVYFIFSIFKVKPNELTISKKALTGIIIVTGIILTAYSYKTITRNRDWKNFLTLYEHDLPYLEKSVKANILYASALTLDLFDTFDQERQTKNIALIKKHYEQALELYPENYEALNNYGSFYSLTLDNYDKAISYFDKAIEVKPDKPEAYYNMGYSYQMLGEVEKAIYYYKESLKIRPENMNLQSDLASLYFETGEIEQAIKINRQIMRLDPKADLPYINIGNYYLQMADSARAISYFEQAVNRVPQVKLCMTISWYYRQKLDTAKTWYYYNLAQQVKEKR